jgi:hypothetical protein
MKLAEEYKIVLSSALDWNAGAGFVDVDSINMKGFHYATFLIDIGTMTGANGTITVHSGPTAGARTSALTFKYAYGSATALWATHAAGHDVLATTATSASLVVVQATYPNYLLVIEVDASAMDVASGEEWLTMRLADVGGAGGLASVFAILKPRYTGGQSASAVV